MGSLGAPPAPSSTGSPWAPQLCPRLRSSIQSRGRNSASGGHPDRYEGSYSVGLVLMTVFCQVASNPWGELFRLHTTPGPVGSACLSPDISDQSHPFQEAFPDHLSRTPRHHGPITPQQASTACQSLTSPVYRPSPRVHRSSRAGLSVVLRRSPLCRSTSVPTSYVPKCPPRPQAASGHVARLAPTGGAALRVCGDARAHCIGFSTWPR